MVAIVIVIVIVVVVVVRGPNEVHRAQSTISIASPQPSQLDPDKLFTRAERIFRKYAMADPHRKKSLEGNQFQSERRSSTTFTREYNLFSYVLWTICVCVCILLNGGNIECSNTSYSIMEKHLAVWFDLFADVKKLSLTSDQLHWLFFSRKINSIFCKVYFSWWCSVCCCKSCLFNLAIPPKTWLVRRPRKHFTQKLQNWSFQRLEFQKSFEQFQHQFGKRCSNYLKYNGFPRDQVSQRIKVGWYAVSFSTVELNSEVGPDDICWHLSEFGPWPNLENA